MIDYIKLIMGFMRNFPAVVLDVKEIFAGPGKVTTKKMNFPGAAADVNVTVSIDSKARTEKRYKVILFITDL